MHIHPFSIIPTISFILILFVGSFVLFHNPRSKLNITFFFMCLTIAFWNAYYITYNLDINNRYTFLFTLISYCNINFIPIALLAFIAEFLNINWIKKWNIFNFIYGSWISFLILTTPYIIDGLRYYSWGYFPKAGKYHPYYLIYFFTLICIFLGTLILYIFKNNKSDFNKLNQSRYMLTAFLVLLIGGLDYTTIY